MAFTGYLAEFSLPEIFQFLEQGHKTGSLTIRTLPTAQSQEVQAYYIWLHQGRIVAAADRLDEKGLVSMIAKRGWASDRVALRISQICPINTPMGLCLKAQGLLQAEQLKLLFRTQVVGLVSTLFELRDGQFEFDAKATLPLAEMTGLSLPATESTLMGLRTLRDWRVLAEKLPDPSAALISMITGKPQLRLDTLESQVWEFANGTVSLRQIAKQLGLPVEKLQQVGFRLIVTNLVEEIPIIADAPTPPVAATSRVANGTLEPMVSSSSPTTVSQSFLQNLVGFLRGKA